MKSIRKRDRVTLVNPAGYVDLTSACVRANQTGYFALSSRSVPESYDSENRDIEVSDLFFGGRKVELAVRARHAEVYANKSAGDPAGAGAPAGDDSAGVSATQEV